MSGDLLRNFSKFESVDYELRRGKKTPTLVVMPGEAGGATELVLGTEEPDEVTFALPMGLARLEEPYTWQIRDQATGRIRTIVTWEMDMSNQVVKAVVRG